MRNILPCPVCSKQLIELSSLRLGESVIRSYKCGHAFAEALDAKKPLRLKSVDDTKCARDYQIEGIDFIVNGTEENPGGFNCIIGDQMRLGKTPQALLALASDYENRAPALILVRSANLHQWIREYKTWTDALPLGIWPIQGSKSFIPPGFSAYICSMDTFSRGDLSDRLLTFGFKVVIVDEAHSFKNVDSKRSQALITFLKGINKADVTKEVPFGCAMCGHGWTESVTINVDTTDNVQRSNHRSVCPKCFANVSQSAAAHVKVTRNCGCVMLTGTPIKNRADEYFVPLNIVAPQKFPSLQRFRQNWLTQDTQGKWSRVKPSYLNYFKQTLRPYVLRREKEDVYTDLPELNKMFTVIEMADTRLRAAYNATLDKIEAEHGDRENFSYFQDIGDLMILRQICGLAKVQWAVEYVEEELENSEKAKIAIGVHHHSVRDRIKDECARFGVMVFSGQESPEQKNYIEQNYMKLSARVLDISTLAGGVGCDFHEIDQALVLERQWNYADESQFEFRFYNPDKSIKSRPTNIEYSLMKGTIDEWFHDMNESKRGNFNSTVSQNWMQEDATSFKQLVRRTLENRL